MKETFCQFSTAQGADNASSSDLNQPSAIRTCAIGTVLPLGPPLEPVSCFDLKTNLLCAVQ